LECRILRRRCSITKTVQNSERDGWHREEIKGHDGFTMVLKECEPAPLGVAAAMDPTEIASYRAFRNLEAELPKLTMDLGRTPTRILPRHPLNQVADFLDDFWPAGASARPPAPIAAERGPVPGDYGV
jgi:hypothetical protein